MQHNREGIMKRKAGFITVCLIILLAHPGWCFEDSHHLAAKESVNCLLSYYSGMAEIQKSDPSVGNGQDFARILAFIKDNRSSIISSVGEMKSSGTIAEVDRFIMDLCNKTISGLGYSFGGSEATGAAYYDEATGHTYIKKYDGAYAEYNRKGAFFRMVPSTQPHLAGSRYVHPMGDDCYLLYVRIEADGKNYKVLPSGKAHPRDGWLIEKALVSID